MFNKKDWFNEYDKLKWSKVIISNVLFLFMLIILSELSFSVDAGQQALVLRFGSASRAVTEGLNLKIPFVERIIYYEMRTLKEQIGVGAASKDLQAVEAVVAINYHLKDEDIITIYRTLGLKF